MTPELLKPLVFYGLAAVTIVSAILVVSRKNVVHSAVFLILMFFSVAGLYILLHAEFLAAVQMLVYAGGIMVLFLFAIMLVNIEEAAKIKATHRQSAVAFGVAGLLFVFLAVVVYRGVFRTLGRQMPQVAAMGGHTEALGSRLFTDYLLPFEIISMLLLIAMIGAIVLSRKDI
jgi:NADH-quinone oxidoreductase subunit J